LDLRQLMYSANLESCLKIPQYLTTSTGTTTAPIYNLASLQNATILDYHSMSDIRLDLAVLASTLLGPSPVHFTKAVLAEVKIPIQANRRRRSQLSIPKRCSELKQCRHYLLQ
jgi:hypothetical protein